MWCKISRAALGLLLVHAVGWNLAAADKDLKSPAEVAAKLEVLAALKAEAAGENNERTKLLNEAWMAAPGLPEANWHTARVRIDDQWLPLGQVASNAANDADLAKYRLLREKAGANAKAIRDLARWCQKQSWGDRARLHYAQLLALSRDAAHQQEAIKELDLHPAGGAWLTGKEVQARREQAKAIEAAMLRWRPKLKALQQVIDGNDFKRRDRAIEELQALADSTTIPVLESFLLDGGVDFQEAAVKRLASFPQYEATQALVHYAVLSRYASSRDAATAALKDRPLHEFVPLLLGGLTAPLRSQFQIRWDNAGRISYVHAVMQEGPSRNALLVSQQLAVPNTGSQTVFTNPAGGEARSSAERSPRPRAELRVSPIDAFGDQQARIAQEAAAKEAELRSANGRIEAANERLVTVLQATTNEPAQQPSEWWNWWQKYNEYRWPKPTQYLYDSNQYAYFAGTISYLEVSGESGTAQPVRTLVSRSTSLGTPYPYCPSCFLAGTPVRTETGQRAIESIQPGDRVLAQDADTGELTYKVVLTTTLRPPAKMLRITAGGEQITTTLGHPFWVNGHGWKMAKELATGDLLHGIGGAVQIEKVEPAGEERAYNLVVDDFNTYFVGQQGLLVHDNEFRKPTRAIVPGLVEELAVAKKL